MRIESDEKKLVKQISTSISAKSGRTGTYESSNFRMEDMTTQNNLRPVTCEKYKIERDKFFFLKTKSCRDGISRLSSFYFYSSTVL